MYSNFFSSSRRVRNARDWVNNKIQTTQTNEHNMNGSFLFFTSINIRKFFTNNLLLIIHFFCHSCSVCFSFFFFCAFSKTRARTLRNVMFLKRCIFYYIDETSLSRALSKAVTSLGRLGRGLAYVEFINW